MTDQSTTQSPPIVADRDIATLLQLLALIADPAAAKAWIEAIAAHQATLSNLIGALDEARAGHEQARISVHTAETASKARIAAEAKGHTEACSERERALNVRETALARVEAETKADREAARKLKVDLERRLNAVRSAAA